jgi:hypothetical protein
MAVMRQDIHQNIQVIRKKLIYGITTLGLAETRLGLATTRRGSGLGQWDFPRH